MKILEPMEKGSTIAFENIPYGEVFRGNIRGITSLDFTSRLYLKLGLDTVCLLNGQDNIPISVSPRGGFVDHYIPYDSTLTLVRKD